MGDKKRHITIYTCYWKVVTRYLTSGVIYIILSHYPHYSSTSSGLMAECSKEMINNV